MMHASQKVEQSAFMAVARNDQSALQPVADSPIIPR